MCSSLEDFSESPLTCLARLSSRTVREATAKDIESVAKVLYHASEPRLKLSFPDMSEADILGLVKDAVQNASEVKTPDATKNMCHWQGFLLAEMGDGNIVGGLKPFTSKDVDFFQLFPNGIIQALKKKYGEEGAKGHIARFVEIDAAYTAPILMLKQPDEPEFHLETVCTFPGFERKGVCKALMEKAFEVGRKQGFKRAKVIALADNLVALSALQKTGFEVKFTILSPDFKRALGSEGLTFLEDYIEEE